MERKDKFQSLLNFTCPSVCVWTNVTSYLFSTAVHCNLYDVHTNNIFWKLIIWWWQWLRQRQRWWQTCYRPAPPSLCCKLQSYLPLPANSDKNADRYHCNDHNLHIYMIGGGHDDNKTIKDGWVAPWFLKILGPIKLDLIKFYNFLKFWQFLDILAFSWNSNIF